jgi:hypothetical protein
MYIPQGHKIYQMARKLTEWSKNTYTNIYIPLQDPPKFTQIGIFGLKMHHLATLATIRCWKPSCRMTYCRNDILSKQHIVETTYCRNDILSKRHIVEMTYCRNDILSKRHIVKTTYCRNDILSKRHIVKILQCWTPWIGLLFLVRITAFLLKMTAWPIPLRDILTVDNMDVDDEWWMLEIWIPTMTRCMHVLISCSTWWTQPT